jgi:hypothetical protein
MAPDFLIELHFEYFVLYFSVLDFGDYFPASDTAWL